MLQLQFFTHIAQFMSIQVVLEALAEYILHAFQISRCSSDSRLDSFLLHSLYIVHIAQELVFFHLSAASWLLHRLCCQLCSNFIINFLLLHFYNIFPLTCFTMFHRSTFLQWNQQTSDFVSQSFSLCLMMCVLTQCIRLLWVTSQDHTTRSQWMEEFLNF